MKSRKGKAEPAALVHPDAAGFVERVTPQKPGKDIYFFKCPKDSGIHFRHAGYVEALAPFIRPGNERRISMEPHQVMVCLKCRSCYVWLNEQLYDITEQIDLEAWAKAETELQAATGPGGEC